VSILRLQPGETAHRVLQVPANATDASATVSWDDGLRGFGDPLLVRGVRWLGLHNDGLMSHPTYIAGWVGLLVTGINLLPVSQLDGGHVARAVLGERMKYAAFASIAMLMFLAYAFRTWLFLALFIVLMGIHHPPPLNDRTPLDRKRLALAIVVLLILVLTFVPVPFQM
jgi:membrane-associated protease RseP (regulator of RpoE activity)